jgi:sec-independent protein translocase protein TatA
MLPQLGFMEMLIIMGVAVLLFGKRLPEVGRSLGKGIIEFKKGLRGLEEGFDFDAPVRSAARPSSTDRALSTGKAPVPGADMEVPKFEPPVADGVPQMDYQPQPTQD